MEHQDKVRIAQEIESISFGMKKNPDAVKQLAHWIVEWKRAGGTVKEIVGEWRRLMGEYASPSLLHLVYPNAQCTQFLVDAYQAEENGFIIDMIKRRDIRNSTLLHVAAPQGDCFEVYIRACLKEGSSLKEIIESPDDFGDNVVHCAAKSLKSINLALNVYRNEGGDVKKLLDSPGSNGLTPLFQTVKFYEHREHFNSMSPVPIYREIIGSYRNAGGCVKTFLETEAPRGDILRETIVLDWSTSPSEFFPLISYEETPDEFKEMYKQWVKDCFERKALENDIWDPILFQHLDAKEITDYFHRYHSLGGDIIKLFEGENENGEHLLQMFGRTSPASLILSCSDAFIAALRMYVEKRGDIRTLIERTDDKGDNIIHSILKGRCPSKPMLYALFEEYRKARGNVGSLLESPDEKGDSVLSLIQRNTPNTMELSDILYYVTGGDVENLPHRVQGFAENWVTSRDR